MATLYPLLVIAIAILGVYSTKEGVSELEKHIETCRVEMNKTPEEMKIIVDVAGNEIYSNDDAGCLIKCIGIKLGVMDDNGKLLPDKLTESAKLIGDVEPENVSQVADLITDCTEIDEADSCLNAFKVHHCLEDKLDNLP